MGAPMARRLVDAGHDVAIVDNDRGRVQALVAAGARDGGDIAAAAADADVVFASLPNGAALEAAVLDPLSGVLSAMKPGTVFVDLSTNSRELTARVAKRCSEQEVLALDAPVSSVSGPPEEGKLTMMLGGSDEAVEQVRPLLEALATNIFHLGAQGTGTVGKLLTQYLALTNMVTAMEAVLVAAKAGVDVEAMVELVPASNGNSFMFQVVRRLADNHDFGTPGQINGLVEIMNKDLSYALELAKEMEVPHAAGAAAGEVFAEAMRRGYGPYHFTRVVQAMEERAGVEIRSDALRKDAS
jgi:3-hydroxyisobutyrate dehydrogenase